MSHSFLPVKFEPERSAHWLPKAGRLAAARLPTRRFWALRICFTDDERDKIWPPWLFVVASSPSPYPVDNASFTLGPRRVLGTGVVVDSDADIQTTAPIPTMESRVSRPLYLHIVPALPLDLPHCSALLRTSFTLTEDSLRTFHDGVARCIRTADDNIREAQATHSPESLKNGWYAPRLDANSDAYMFGEPSNPHKYVFDFGFHLPLDTIDFPAFEVPPTVYDELMLYNQLCEDYNWRGANHAVQWLQEMRQNVASGGVGNPSPLTELPTEPCLDDDVRKRAMELAALDNPLAVISSVLKDSHARRLERATNTNSDSSYRSDDSEVLFLPTRFPHIPYRYFDVPFGSTKVIAFDIFGTILDRENAISTALSPWFAQSPVRGSTTLELVIDWFLTHEALVERDALSVGNPASLATCARSALIDLAGELRLNVDVHSTVFTDALKLILSPEPYPDVDAAITTLQQRGYTLLYLPTQSATTMQQLRPAFPPAFAGVRTWTGHISAHFVASAANFLPLQSFCESLVNSEAPLQPSEILVVSSSIGRVLHAAMTLGHATAWVRRPHNLEGRVNFVVGEDKNSSPVPSLVVSGLTDLVASL